MTGPSRLAALLLAAGSLSTLAAQTPQGRAGEARPWNVLLICVDDLRPELSGQGGMALTPSLDALAASGRPFLRHYVQVPTCGASRRCLLTSRRPRTRAHLGNDAFRHLGEVREDRPESWVHALRQAGYETVSLGKVSHSPDGRFQGTDQPELPASFDRRLVPDWPWPDAWAAFFGYADHTGRTRGESPPFERVDSDDHAYPDAWTADAAIAELGRLSRGEQPFLLAVGFFKPHLPFNSPAAHWDAYEPASIPLADWREAPAGLERPLDVHGSGEFLGNYGQHPPERPLPEHYQRTVRHAYLAAVRYVDAQIGRVLAALEEQALADRTVVVLWSDHGWHLGEHGVFGKHTPLEWSLRSPLILRVPGMDSPGVVSEALVESLDVGPTLLELCGVPAPPDLDGRSLVPQLAEPGSPHRAAARSWWRKGPLTARTLRSPTHRLVLWEEGGAEAQVELFDHRSDPGETRSVHQEQGGVVATLRARLEAADTRLDR